MNELINLVQGDGEFPVDAKELHEKLEVQTRFDIWLNRRIEEYDFIAGQDFCTNLNKSTGGRRATEYWLTIDMGKELAMLENNEAGRAVRRYFIAAEKAYRENRITTQISKAIRRELTDALKDSGLNEKMHGFGYKTFTDLIYKLVLNMNAKQFRVAKGLEKTANVRDYLNQYQLQEVGRLEKAVQSMIDIGMEYDEIKMLLTNKFLPKFEDIKLISIAN